MPQLIPCADCQKKIRVPDEMIGKRIKCPNCGATFVALGDDLTPMAAAPLAPLMEFDDEPLPRKGKEAVEIPRDPDTWGPVLTGVNLQMIAHFLFIAGALFQSLTLFIFLVRDEPKKVEFFERFLGNCLTVSYILFLLNWLLSIIASGCFLTAPGKHGSRGWAAACLALTILVFLDESNALRYLNMGLTSHGERTFGFMPAAPFQRSGVVSLGLGFMLAGLPELARLLALPMYLRSIGRNLNDSGLVNFGLYASFAAPVLYGLSIALDLLLNLIEESKSASVSSRKDEEQAIALIMLFLHTLALLLVLLANVLIAFRARSTLQKAART